MRQPGIRARKDISHFRYMLGEEVAVESKICIHSFRNLFHIGKKSWKRLSSAALSKPPGPIWHGNVGSQNRHFGSTLFDTERDVVAFLRQVALEHGESYATRFVHERTSVGLRNEEEDAVDLSSYMSKRYLYKRYVVAFVFVFYFLILFANHFFRFCFEHGHIVSTTAKGTIALLP